MADPFCTRILVPVDFSPCSGEAFRVALTLAKTFQAELLLLHVIDTSALAAFNRLGLLAVPSDAQAQKRRLRHHARLNARQLLGSEMVKGVKVTRVLADGVPFVEIAKMVRVEKNQSGGVGQLWGAIGKYRQNIFRQYGRKGGADCGLSGVDRSVAIQADSFVKRKKVSEEEHSAITLFTLYGS